MKKERKTAKSIHEFDNNIIACIMSSYDYICKFTQPPQVCYSSFNSSLVIFIILAFICFLGPSFTLMVRPYTGWSTCHCWLRIGQWVVPAKCKQSIVCGWQLITAKEFFHTVGYFLHTKPTFVHSWWLCLLRIKSNLSVCTYMLWL